MTNIIYLTKKYIYKFVDKIYNLILLIIVK